MRAIALLLIVTAQTALAQDVVIISQQGAGSKQFGDRIASEIKSLRNNTTVKHIHTRDLTGSKAAITTALTAQGTKLIIGADVINSQLLTNQRPLSKPTIAGIVIDEKLQAIGAKADPNFNYLVPPINVARDLKLLAEIRNYKHLGVVITPELASTIKVIPQYLRTVLPNKSIKLTMIPYRKDMDVKQSFATVDAVLILPLADVSNSEKRQLYRGISNLGLPSVALAGRRETLLGAMASTTPDVSAERIVRRIAINATKILAGQRASDLPTDFGPQSSDVTINMDAARRASIFPDYDVLNRATLVAITAQPNANKLGFQRAIGIALDKSLALKVAIADAKIAERDRKSAVAAYLPQVTASGNLLVLDEKQVEQAFGQRGRVALSGRIALSQVIYSERVFANLAISKHLQEAARLGLRNAQNEVVVNVAKAYFANQIAQLQVEIANDNVQTTKQNLDIAVARKNAGNNTDADIFRWKSQLALARMDLLDAEAKLRAARLALNREMNVRLDKQYSFPKENRLALINEVLDARYQKTVTNQGDFLKLATFLAKRAQENSPQIAQLNKNVEAAALAVRSNKRSFFIPEVGVFAQLDHVFHQWDVPTSMFGSPLTTTWQAGISLSIPLFEGGARYHQQKQLEQEYVKAKTQLSAARLQVEQGIKANLAQVSANFGRMRLAAVAADNAEKSLNLVQDLYRRGATNITVLLDSQNASREAQVLAATLTYTFISSFIETEGLFGQFYFLSTQEARDKHFADFQSFLRANKGSTK